MITIGVPVHNENKYIINTLESIVMNYDAIERVIISDNASIDSTENIISRYLEKYSKMEYVRYDNNIGAVNNFKNLLFAAHTKYFMWLGGHDAIPANYISTILEALENHPGAALAYGACKVIDQNGNVINNINNEYWDELSSDEPFIRTWCLANHINSNYMFYGIFDTNKLKSAFCDKPIIGSDNVTTLRVSVLGKIIYIPETYYCLRKVRNETLIERNERYRRLFGWDKKRIPRVNPFRFLYIEYLNILLGISNRWISKNDIEKALKPAFEKAFGNIGIFSSYFNYFMRSSRDILKSMIIYITGYDVFIKMVKFFKIYKGDRI